MKQSTTVVCAVSLLIAFCSLSCDRPPTKFFVGQKVKHVLDERVGIVLFSRRLDKDYKVRFVCDESTTNTHLFHNDSPVSHAPYAVVWCEEFELENMEGR